jgi:hypothetical protein
MASCGDATEFYRYRQCKNDHRLFYQQQESRLLAELIKVMDYSGGDSGVNLKEATVSFVSFRESNKANKTANLFL